MYEIAHRVNGLHGFAGTYTQMWLKYTMPVLHKCG